MTERALADARAGDENAFRDLTDPYRHELQLHCYRIVGSTQDAEDLVQETLLAAWRGLQQFGERASIRTWLYHVPPQQRAVLVLRDVLNFQAAEVAEILDTTDAAVNSLLRRARGALDTRLPAAGRERAPLPNSRSEREVVGRFADAVEAGDIETVVELLTDDAWLRMPPQPYEYHGAAAIGRFLDDRQAHRGAPLRLVPTRANGQPAFGCYLPSPHTDIARPSGLLVLTLAGHDVAEITWFADCSVFPHFGLPRTLPI